MQGESIVPFLRQDGARGRPLFFFEHHLPYDGWIPSSEGIRTTRWKYIRYTDNAAPFEELYDLNVDRFETRNLAGMSDRQNEQRLLGNYLEKWRTSLRGTAASWREPIGLEDLRRDGLEAL
jgi:hypothetical protein